jgi:hypothetical protein
MLTTHLLIVPRSKNEWSYTSTPPLSLHGVVLSSSTGTNLHVPFIIVPKYLKISRLWGYSNIRWHCQGISYFFFNPSPPPPVLRNWRSKRKNGLPKTSHMAAISNASFVLQGYHMRVYPKVSGLAAWSQNCKQYSSLPLGAVASLFWESI